MIRRQIPPVSSTRPHNVTPDSLYDNSAYQSTLILAAVKQAPVAIGDIFASRALRGLALGQPIAQDLVALAACHTLPAGFGAIASMRAASWRKQSTRGVVQGITQRMFGQTARWVEARPRADEHAHRLANDVPWVLGMLVDVAPARAEALGTLGVQAVLMGLLLEPVAALSLVAALAAAYACGRMSQNADTRELDRSKLMTVPYSDNAASPKAQKDTIETRARRGEEPHLLYGRIRNRYWDNVTLGNHYNFERWRCESDAIGAIFADDGIRRAQRRTDFQALSGLLSGLIVGGALAAYAHVLHARGEHEKLTTVLFPLLARTTSIVGQTQNLLQTHHDMLAMQSIFSRLLGETQSEARLKLLDKVSHDLNIQDGLGNTYTTRQLLDHPPRQGRLTLRGQNGRGKSMFAAALKEVLGRRAWLIPATHGLTFAASRGSSGETALANLAALKQDLESYTSVSTLILDEWDANLDVRNRELASLWIDDMAATHLVIEITHAPTYQAEELAHA